MANKMWTITNIQKLVDIWNTKSTKDIARELKIKPSQVSYMAQAIRQAGGKLERKHIPGQTRSLIRKALGL